MLGRREKGTELELCRCSGGFGQSKDAKQSFPVKRISGRNRP